MSGWWLILIAVVGLIVLAIVALWLRDEIGKRARARRVGEIDLVRRKRR